MYRTIDILKHWKRAKKKREKARKEQKQATNWKKKKNQEPMIEERLSAHSDRDREHCLWIMEKVLRSTVKPHHNALVIYILHCDLNFRSFHAISTVCKSTILFIKPTNVVFVRWVGFLFFLCFARLCLVHGTQAKVLELLLLSLWLRSFFSSSSVWVCNCTFVLCWMQFYRINTVTTDVNSEKKKISAGKKRRSLPCCLCDVFVYVFTLVTDDQTK